MVDFTQLNSEFLEKIKLVISKMETVGYSIQPQSGFRSLLEQGKLWRQGRPLSVIKEKIRELRAAQCDVLADAIEDAGPQMKNVICTHTIPGYSWHNWGQALDVFVNNDPSGCDELYGVLADKAVALGLTSGFNFKRFKDPGHLQLSALEVPKIYSLKEVNAYFSHL